MQNQAVKLGWAMLGPSASLHRKGGGPKRRACDLPLPWSNLSSQKRNDEPFKSHSSWICFGLALPEECVALRPGTGRGHADTFASHESATCVRDSHPLQV